MVSWYHKHFGRTLLNAERKFLDKIMPKLFGYYLVQLGGPSDYDFLLSSPIVNKLRVDPNDLAHADFIRADFDALPFLSDSIYVMVISHVLEFERNPKAVLAESYHALVPEGHLIVLGFNPFSLYGLLKFFKRGKEFPWHGRFLRMGKVCNWLKSLGFEIVARSTCCFDLPLGSYCLPNPSIIEKILHFLFPYCGAGYILVCKKKVVTLTPVKARLLHKRLAFKSTMSNVSCRERYEEN